MSKLGVKSLNYKMCDLKISELLLRIMTSCFFPNSLHRLRREYFSLNEALKVSLSRAVKND